MFFRRFFLELYLSTHDTSSRYKILYAKGVKDSMEPKEATKVILEGAAVDPEQWRLGHTKVAGQTVEK